MSVRAKFRVQKVEIQLQDRYERDEKGNHARVGVDELRTIIMAPVSANNDPDHENSRFWRMSPSGELRLGTINRSAWESFELGKEYYVDFTEAPNA